MSYAPELPAVLELAERIAALGIVPAAGHSAAREEHVREAMQRGLRHIIHIWSGQSTTVREGPWRRPGLLEASLVFAGLSVELIADQADIVVFEEDFTAWRTMIGGRWVHTADG